MGFLGMRGTGDWVAGQRPYNWRQQIMYLYPNGMAPLTAILSMMGNEGVTDPEFYWWEDSVDAVYTTIVAGEVYTTPDMAALYAGGGVATDVIYARVPSSFATLVRVGHQLMFRDDSDPNNDVVGKCVHVDVNGANPVVGVRLLENDDNGTGGLTDITNADQLMVIGSIHSEGAEMPDTVNKDPTKIYNKTQIFRTSLSVTGTAEQTELRTEAEYQKQKREKLEAHGLEMEMAFLFGIMTERTGDNGKPERTTRGIVNFVKTYAPNNVSHYPTSVEGVGVTWLNGGALWLNNHLEPVFRYGASEKLALCGSQVVNGITQLAMNGATINLTPKDEAYGLKILQWISPFGTLYLKTHPLMSSNPTLRDAMIILEPKELKYRNVRNRDTKFYPDKSSGRGRVDGKNEEWLTEAGLEMHHPSKFGYLTGFNING
jgi:hypothetical protein